MKKPRRSKAVEPSFSLQSSWDLSQERAFLENLTNQRVNFFLLFFSLVILAAVEIPTDYNLLTLLFLFGAVISGILLSGICRGASKLDEILDLLKRDKNHPHAVLEAAVGSGSRRNIVMVWMPGLCTAALLLLALISATNIRGS